MAGPEDSAAKLADLEASHESGCLTIVSPSHGECRVYLLGGRILLVEGPNSKGDAALAAALGWRDATLSFDDTAEPPAAAIAAPDYSDIGLVESVPVARLSDDPRLVRMARASTNWLLLFVIGPFALMVIAAAVGLTGVVDWHLILGVMTLAIAMLVILAVVAGVMFIRFRRSILRDAIVIRGGAPPAGIPTLLQARAGVISGRPTLQFVMRTRCPVGDLGRCRIDLFSNGLQISKHSTRPELRWEFSFRDILQAECVVLRNYGQYGAIEQALVRLIVDQPRMAFLLGAAWFGTTRQNRDAHRLVNELRRHGVPTFDEDFES